MTVSDVQYAMIDFHSHFVGPALALHSRAGAPELCNRDAVGASLEENGLSARVISTPLEFVRQPGTEASPGMVQRANDSVAEVVAMHPGRVYGLATVDAYSGEPAAEELTRAVRVLGLRGVFVESAKGDLLPDCPQAQPTFAAACALGVPVFLHPVPDAPLKKRFAGCGGLAERLVRSTVNSAALLAMLECGMLERHRGLRVVVTALALGGLAVAAGRLRKRIFVDTTILHPAVLRAAVDLVGADHVVAGSDWPVNKGPMRRLLADAMRDAGLADEEQSAIAQGNCRRLLGIGEMS